MKILIDTHIAIWAVLNDPKLPSKAKEIILNEDNGYFVLPILNMHVSKLETLKRSENVLRHNDPFDRIMVAQAKAENIMFLTDDSLIPQYNEPFIISV